MPNLLVRPSAPDRQGRVHAVTPASAGWTYVGFEVYRLDAGAGLRRDTGDREACLVMLGGRATVSAGGRDLGTIGGGAPPLAAPPGGFLVVRPTPPPGHGSSYPPHKHDRDALPEESLLEETYSPRVDPPQ